RKPAGRRGARLCPLRSSTEGRWPDLRARLAPSRTEVSSITELRRRLGPCRKAMAHVASVRECPPVPEQVPAWYPRGLGEITEQTTIQPLFCRVFTAKPPDGLEPSTPLPVVRLPCKRGGWRGGCGF